MSQKQDRLLLKGEKDNYYFSTADSKSIIKSNGELSSSIIGSKESDNSKVLIKKIHSRLMGKKEAIHRFVRESSFQINHPNVEFIKELINQDGSLYLIRDFVEGVDLKTFSIKWNSKLQSTFIIKCVIQTLDALEELHKNNIIHCDIKPSNIILVTEKNNQPNFDDPQVKLIDFGLAHYFGDNPLTKNSKLPFSFIYAPPEQVLGKWDLINSTCDIYSLGVTLYELIGQQTPFWHENPLMVMQLQIAQQLQPNLKIEEKLFEIINKASSKPIFTKPPRLYSKRELDQILKEAQIKRYQYAVEFRDKLIKFIDPQ